MRFQIVSVVLAAIISSVMAAPIPVPAPEPQAVSDDHAILDPFGLAPSIGPRPPLPYPDRE